MAIASFNPREPYTDDELQRLYPTGLELQLVQILLRHGERTPVSPRFRNAGLRAYWPYCGAAQRLSATIMQGAAHPEWSTLEWRRRLETFAQDDQPTITTGPNGSLDAICQPGELTDLGRQTTYALGQRLRKLYVEQLGFMPRLISDSDSIYLRTTPVPRALESLQQAFVGFYPPSARTAAFPPPTIITRSPADETLYPNDGVCRRFAELSRAFAQRSADRWNESPEMGYISSKIGKWMPDGNDGRVKVDSRPRLSGVMDTISATDAHGADTKLPKEFYDSKMRDIINRISMEEWFSGYLESREYRTLGIGSHVADILARMVGNVEHSTALGVSELGGDGNKDIGIGRGGETAIKFAMSGCHDTTIAAALSSLGCFEHERWPPFTSHVAFELFKHNQTGTASASSTDLPSHSPQQQPSLWSRFFGLATKASATNPPIGRTPLHELSPAQKSTLSNHYVRIRYNDRIMTLPGCATPGNHLEGDATLCTLKAFKAIVDDFTPRNWKAACALNIGRSAFPERDEPAGLAPLPAAAGQ